jgi:sugar lactone lactonase YvrE
MSEPNRILAKGFAFPECPRWRDGTLWFSDQHGAKVYCLAPDGGIVESFEVPGRPSGLGWLPDGDLLVVSMRERRLYRRRDGALSFHADLSGLHPAYSNDMVIDAAGRAYVGNIGFDFDAGETYRPTAMAMVSPDGHVSLAAGDIACPNGTVIAPDGRTLIVAQSMGRDLLAFDVGEDGALSGRRVFATLGEHVPDGICLDAEGCVWFASPFAGGVFRVREGGDIIGHVPVDGAYACMLGGEDGRDLFICAAPHHEPALTVKALGGRIEIARAPARAAGWP